MRVLLDSGVLLRLPNRADALHPKVRDAVRSLKAQGHTFCTFFQNVAEFWNVCTRPATARGGLGRTHDQARHRLRIVERAVRAFEDAPGAYDQWKRLIHVHHVSGVQVHDARLVAFMTVHRLTHILTLNAADFRRYPGVTALPADGPVTI